MKVHLKLSFLLVTFGLVAWLAFPARAEDAAASQIKAEIARLHQSLKDKPIADKDAAQAASAADGALRASYAAADAGQLYLALEKLGQAEDLLYGARSLADKTEVEKGGMPAFQSKWGKVSLRLTALDKEAHARTWKNSPLAVRALAEAAQGKALPLLEGGQGFAVANGPKDGLFYVGEAQGLTDFATWCASLTFSQKAAAFPLRSLLPELQSLQTKTNAAFQPPKSVELHSLFITLNSRLKLAQELDASKFYAGALYAYLEATGYYAMLDAPVLDAAQQAQLKQDLAAARRKLAASSQDNSLAQLFLQRAESYSNHPDGSAPAADEWRGARVILDQVLPAYYAAQKPAAPLDRASGKTVEITLVRWPYT